MGLRVNTNVASLTAQRHMLTVTQRLQRNFARLSSGLRIATAADDAAGLAISERMRAQIRSYSVAARNAQDGISLAQTAEGAMGEITNLLSRMRELAMQSANGTLSTGDRAPLQVEFSALIQEIDRVANDTEFNSLPLLNAATTVAIQVGIDQGETIDLTFVDVRAAALGIDTLDIGTQAGADAALAATALDAAITTLNTRRGDLGAGQNRMTSALASILTARENLSASESRIRDVDVAAETADLTRNSIMQQASVSILQQANLQPQIALSLLQG